MTDLHVNATVDMQRPVHRSDDRRKWRTICAVDGAPCTCRPEGLTECFELAEALS